MNKLNDERVIIKQDIYDALGRIYIAKGKIVTLDSIHMKKFERLGILDQILKNKEKNNKEEHYKNFENEIKQMNNKYNHLAEKDFNNAVADVQKFIFGERIFRKYPYLGTLTEHDGWFYTHSVNVAILSVLLARAMGYDENTIREIVIGAILHDIGVILIEKEILEKEEAELTQDERYIKEKHCKLGVMIVKSANIPIKIQKIIEQHHEKIDGTGYPNELKGQEILEEAQIIGIADTLDTGTSYRPTGEIKGIEEMIEEMYNLPHKYDRKYTQILKEVFEV